MKEIIIQYNTVINTIFCHYFLICIMYTYWYADCCFWYNKRNLITRHVTRIVGQITRLGRMWYKLEENGGNWQIICKNVKSFFIQYYTGIWPLSHLILSDDAVEDGASLAWNSIFTLVLKTSKLNWLASLINMKSKIKPKEETMSRYICR